MKKMTPIVLLMLLLTGLGIGAMILLNEEPEAPQAERDSKTSTSAKHKSSSKKSQSQQAVIKTPAEGTKEAMSDSPTIKPEAVVNKKETKKGSTLAELLSAHHAAYVSGKHEVVSAIAKKAKAFAPLSKQEEFPKALEDETLFGAKMSLLFMLDKRDGDFIWSTLQENLELANRFTTPKTNWAEREEAWLHQLIYQGVPFATGENGGVETLTVLAKALPTGTMSTALWAGMREIETSERPAFVSFLREQLDARPQEADVIVSVLLHFAESEEDRMALLDDKRFEKQLCLLLAEVISGKLLSSEETLKRARRAILQTKNEHAPLVLGMLSEHHPKHALEIARSLVDMEQASEDMVRIAMNTIAKEGNDEEAAELLQKALSQDHSSLWAAQALANAHRIPQLEELFQASNDGAMKVVAFASLIHRDRDRWLDLALRNTEPLNLRKAALSYLAPQRERDLARLKEVGTGDPSASLRLTAFKKLSAAKDTKLIPYFQERYGSESDATVRTQIKNFLGRLKRIKKAEDKR